MMSRGVRGVSRGVWAVAVLLLVGLGTPAYATVTVSGTFSLPPDTLLEDGLHINLEIGYQSSYWYEHDWESTSFQLLPGTHSHNFSFELPAGAEEIKIEYYLHDIHEGGDAVSNLLLRKGHLLSDGTVSAYYEYDSPFCYFSSPPTEHLAIEALRGEKVEGSFELPAGVDLNETVWGSIFFDGHGPGRDYWAYAHLEIEPGQSSLPFAAIVPEDADETRIGYDLHAEHREVLTDNLLLRMGHHAPGGVTTPYRSDEGWSDLPASFLEITALTGELITGTFSLPAGADRDGMLEFDIEASAWKDGDYGHQRNWYELPTGVDSKAFSLVVPGDFDGMYLNYYLWSQEGSHNLCHVGYLGSDGQVAYDSYDVSPFSSPPTNALSIVALLAGEGCGYYDDYGEPAPVTWSPAQKEGDRLFVYEFGPVEVGSSVTQEFTLTNEGSQTLYFDEWDYHADSGAYSFTNNCDDAGTLAPNQSCTLEVVFTPPYGGCFFGLTDFFANETYETLFDFWGWTPGAECDEWHEGETPSFIQYFQTGWNLAAVPYSRNLSGTDFSDKAAHIHTVWAWQGGQWRAWAADTALQTRLEGLGYLRLNSVEPGEGFWLHARSGFSANYYENDPYDLLSHSRLLEAGSGWHLLGSGSSLTPEEVVSVRGGIQVIWGYSEGQWRIYAPDSATMDRFIANGVAPLEVIEKGQGLWLKIQ